MSENYVYVVIDLDSDKVYGIYTKPLTAHQHSEELNITYLDMRFTVRRMNLDELANSDILYGFSLKQLKSYL
jgi:hypothetical protein